MSDTIRNPSRDVYLITPHATNPLAKLPRAIRADGAGTICFRAIDSSVDVTLTFAAGEQLDVQAKYVRASGTTVSVIHGIG